MPFVSIWTFIGLDTHRGNQPLYRSSQIIFWLWRCDSHIVQTAKLRRDVQGDVLITILDLFVFPNITTTTKFYVHRCELSKCELLLPERLTSGSTMINKRWCHNCKKLHVYNIWITKLWALSSYFLYLHGFSSNCFPSITESFRCSFYVSNLIQTFQTDLVESSTQYSLVIYNSLLLQTILYPVNYVCTILKNHILYGYNLKFT